MKQKFSSRKTITNLMIGICAVAIINACSKSNNTPVTPTPTNSYVSVTNASAGTNSYGVYSDTSNIYTTGTGSLGYGNSTGITGGSPYETIVSGTHSIKLTNGSNSMFLDSAGTFSSNGYYSFFVYDTGANIKTLALNDNLAVPTTGNAEVRFINLSPNSTSVNLWLTNVDTTTKDSVEYMNSYYAGSNMITSDTLSSFRTIMAGTYNIAVNTTADVNLYKMDSVTFAAGRIYTLYTKGYVAGQTDSLGVGIITIINGD